MFPGDGLYSCKQYQWVACASKPKVLQQMAVTQPKLCLQNQGMGMDDALSHHDRADEHHGTKSLAPKHYGYRQSVVRPKPNTWLVV